MANEVIAADVAAKQLSAMEEEFGPLPDKDSRDVIVRAIMRGLVDFDEASASITILLQKPVELENGKTFDSVTLVEPTIEQLQRIDKGQMIKVEQGKTMEIDASIGHSQLIKLVSVIGNVPIGVVPRMKRRDEQVLQAVSGFFS